MPQPVLSSFGDPAAPAAAKPAPAVSSFGDPAAPAVPGGTPAAPPQPVSWGDTALDVAKAIPRGVRQGYEGVAGLGGDFYNLEVSGAGKLAKMLGASPETLAQIEATRKEKSSWLPTSEDVRQNVTNKVFGEEGTPTTKTGEVFQTGASMLPSLGSSGFVRGVLAPTLGIEAGGEVGKRFFGNEQAGRAIGGLAGAMTPGVTTKTLTRGVSPERRAQVNTLLNEDIPITGGQATGSKAMQYAEAGPFAGKAERINQSQGSAFNRAALRRAEIAGDSASTDVMHEAQQSFGRQYDDLIARNHGVTLDPTLEHELLDNVTSYERLKGQQGVPAVNQYFGRISDAAQQNGGVIPPDVFHSIRSDIASDLARLSKGDGNADTIASLRRFQDSMYGSITRNGQPEVAATSRTLNNNYRNFKTIEKAMGGAGEETSRGMITPQKLRGAVERGDKTGWVQGRGDFNDLAKAGEGVMKPLPQSGTAARMAPIAIASALTSGAGQIMAGNKMAGLGLFAGAALPPLLSKVLTSGPMRTGLVNEVAGGARRQPMLTPMVAALLARQLAGGQQ